MGAWRSVRHRVEAAVPPGVRLSYVGPPLARQPVRGLHLGALPRAGPHRARRARPAAAARCLARAESPTNSTSAPVSKRGNRAR